MSWSDILPAQQKSLLLDIIYGHAASSVDHVFVEDSVCQHYKTEHGNKQQELSACWGREDGVRLGRGEGYKPFRSAHSLTAL